MGWLFGIKNQLEALKKQMDAGNVEAAVAIADKIPDSRIKNYVDLMLVAKAYKKSGDYAQAKQLYQKAKEKRTSKAVLLDLMDCCLMTKELEEADRYFDEFHKVAPDDTAALYTYRYKIEKSKKRDPALLVTILEELKEIDYSEEYAYELAKQYHKAGMAEKCMQECQEIILWFAEGAIVERAKALLAYYRGEISLEEIKTVGERYVAEQQAKQETENEKQLTAGKEQEGAQELKETGRTEEEPAADTGADEGSTLDFPLPEIDLSCIDFSEEEKENIREGYELFVLEDTDNMKVPATKSGKVEEILAEKDISLTEICKNFARMGAVRRQMLKSLDLMLTERGRISLVITGEEKSGKTTLALDMVKLLYQMGIIRYDRTAVTDAAKLNAISLTDRMEEIKNCNLIIERAGSIEDRTLEELLTILKGKEESTCLILEDTSRNINKVLRGKEELNRKFNNRIHLSKYTTEDLLGFAYDHIVASDYTIDKLAAEVLKEKIEDIVKKGADEGRLTSTIELVEQALASAERRNEQTILKMAAAGQFKPGNFLVLLKEDFIP